MAEYELLLGSWKPPPPPHTLVKYAALKADERGEGRRWEGGKKAHLEVGTVPQQVPRAPIPSMVTLNSRDPGPRKLVWNTVWVLLRVRGGEVGGGPSLTLQQPGSG